MDYKYKLNIYCVKGTLINTLYTKEDVITIGSGLFNSIRIQIPSILELHLKIFLNQLNVLTFGNNVKVNDTELILGRKTSFKIGDIIKIHNRGFQIEYTDTTSIIDQSKIIKECPDDLKQYLNCYEIEPDLFVNSNQNEISINEKIESPSKMMTNQNKESSTTKEQNTFNSEITNENQISNNQKQNLDETKENIYQSKLEPEMVNNMNNEIMENKSCSETMENNMNSEIMENNMNNEIMENNMNNENDKIVITEDNEIVKQETHGNVCITTETNIHREVTSSHYIKEGVIYEQIKEQVDINEYQETGIKKEAEEEAVIKNNFEIQAAVKIIDASSSETKAEEALEEGNLDTIKEAIVSKQIDLNEEIKESMDSGIIVDTPINPLPAKKQVKDLGESVIAKEILKDAEKVVDDQIVATNGLEHNKSANKEETFFIKDDEVPDISASTKEDTANLTVQKDENLQDFEYTNLLGDTLKTPIQLNETKNDQIIEVEAEDEIENEAQDLLDKSDVNKNAPEKVKNKNEENKKVKNKNEENKKVKKAKLGNQGNKSKNAPEKNKFAEKSNLISKLTATPRATRKASMAAQNTDFELVAPKRAKKNATNIKAAKETKKKGKNEK